MDFWEREENLYDDKSTGSLRDPFLIQKFIAPAQGPVERIKDGETILLYTGGSSRGYCMA